MLRVTQVNSNLQGVDAQNTTASVDGIDRMTGSVKVTPGEVLGHGEWASPMADATTI